VPGKNTLVSMVSRGARAEAGAVWLALADRASGTPPRLRTALVASLRRA